jgi:hypothetical protein
MLVLEPWLKLGVEELELAVEQLCIGQPCVMRLWHMEVFGLTFFCQYWSLNSEPIP